MTILERIKIIKQRHTRDYLISVFDNSVEYSPENTWFYLQDTDHLGEDILELPVLQNELDEEVRYQKDGIQCIGLSFHGLRDYRKRRRR